MNAIIKHICKGILGSLVLAGIIFMLVMFWPYLEIAIVFILAFGYIIDKASEE